MNRAPGSAVASAPGEGPRRRGGPRDSRVTAEAKKNPPTVDAAASKFGDGLNIMWNGVMGAVREEVRKFLAAERGRQEEMLSLNMVCERFHVRKSDVSDDIESGKLKAQKIPRKCKSGSTKEWFEYRVKGSDAEEWFAARIARAQQMATAGPAIPGRGTGFYA